MTNLIQLIGFNIVELLQILGFACFLGLMIIITGCFSVYIFVFIFRGIFSEISQSESLAELEVDVFGDKSESAIFIFLDFQFPAQEKSGSFPYKAH